MSLWNIFENRQLAVFEGKCRRFRNSSECLKTHCASNYWPIWTQTVPKEAYRCGLKTSIRVFQKIFCLTWAVGCRKFVQYIRMLYTGRFILVESVCWKQNLRNIKVLISNKRVLLQNSPHDDDEEHWTQFSLYLISYVAGMNSFNRCSLDLSIPIKEINYTQIHHF